MLSPPPIHAPAFHDAGGTVFLDHLLFKRSVMMGMTTFGEESKTSCRESPAHACQATPNQVCRNGARCPTRSSASTTSRRVPTCTAPLNLSPWKRARVRGPEVGRRPRCTPDRWGACTMCARSPRAVDTPLLPTPPGICPSAVPRLPPSGCTCWPVHARVAAVSRALRRVEDDTGQRVIYCPHVTGRPDQMLEVARAAVEAGATGLMVNVFAAGLAALQMLSEDADTQVPIYVHSGGRSALAHRPGNGIDVRVFARFARLLGGDYLDLYAQGGYLRTEAPAQTRELADVLRAPWGAIAPVVPTCSGGLTPQTLAANYETLGRDILPMAGSAIFGHPLGAAAGVAAPRPAAPRYFPGLPPPPGSRSSFPISASIRGSGVLASHPAALTAAN